MRDEKEKMAANICVVSHHAATTAVDEAYRRAAMDLCGDVRRLAEIGYRVTWITSTEAIDACASDMALEPSQNDLPLTCRYVLPCQPYRLAGAAVFAVDREVWRDTARQTRLFSFLCLMYRELAWNVVHARGELAAVFVAIYTAQFLGIPALVSYDDALIVSGEQQPFVWRWINRHVALASVRCEADRLRVLEMGELASENIRMGDAGHLGADVLYAELTSTQKQLLSRRGGGDCRCI